MVWSMQGNLLLTLCHVLMFHLLLWVAVWLQLTCQLHGRFPYTLLLNAYLSVWRKGVAFPVAETTRIRPQGGA
jgi:hypothetical protein